MSNDYSAQLILIADDNPNNLKVLSETLNSFGYNVSVAINGKAAVESAKVQPPDLILLDVHMPEMDGYEACKALKSDNKTKEIPVIFISSLDEQFNKVKAFEVGAVDYITKPIQIDETRARVDVHMQLNNKMQELDKFNKVMVDREMRIIELKEEINKLSSQLGKNIPYPEVWE